MQEHATTPTTDGLSGPPAGTRDDDAGLTPTEDRTLSGTVDLEALDSSTVTAVWRALLKAPAVQDALVTNVRALADGATVPELYDALEARSVPYWLRSWIRDVARGDRRAAWRVAADLAPKVGTDVGTVEDLLAVAGLFDAGDATPTVSIAIPPAFRERRRDQRTDVCRLLAVLAGGLDVRIVASTVTRRWLAQNHRDDLPGVSEWCSDHPDAGPVETLVEEALAMLDPDGTPVEILRRVADEPTETLSYGALYSNPAFPSNSAVRQHLGTLSDLELVEQFGPTQDKRVELRTAGREYLATLVGEIGRQQPLDGRVSDTQNSSPQAVLSRGAREGGKDAGPYTVEYYDRANHAAAAGVADSADVTVAEDALTAPTARSSRTHYVSVDEERREIVAAVEATDALPFAVSSAVALSSPLVLEPLLTDDRLDAVDEPPAILRDARCIGGLSEDALEDADALRETLVEWGKDVGELTTALQRGEYDDRDRFRGEIVRSAHGLAGSIVHLADVFGFDVVREVRVPAELEERQHRALSKSMAVATSIQSRYESFATYRQLFEERDDKRATAFSPEVDATDPTGEFIGSLVVRGPDVHRFRPHLKDALGRPADLHEDAPEFVVPVSVATADRRATAAVTARVCSMKRLDPTREAVSLLDALVSSPYDVAHALQQLGSEVMSRDIQPDEVRYALATLPAAALVADLPPTVGKILATLLRTDRRLTQAEVADRADVSTQSVRTHRAALSALGIVEVTENDTIRLSLSFAALEGDSRGVYPGFEAGKDGFAEAVDAVAAAVTAPEAYADPDGEIFEALSWPPAPWQLLEDEHLAPWVRLAGRLVDAAPPDQEDDVQRVTFGPTVEQVPVVDAGTPTPTPAD